MKKLFVLIISALLCLALIPSVFADDVTLWDRLDYGDVVVHIMHREERETYAIEKFWNHAFTVSEEAWMELSKEYSEYTSV